MRQQKEIKLVESLGTDTLDTLAKAHYREHQTLAVNPHSAVYIAELERTVLSLRTELIQAKKLRSHEYQKQLELESYLGAKDAK